MKLTPEQLIGRKVRGFEFKDQFISFSAHMKPFVGQVGEITDININYIIPYALVTFEKFTTWHYPLDQIEQHLVEETEVLDIPELPEGMAMEVSNDGEVWWERSVFAQTKGLFIAWKHGSPYESNAWKYARPIPAKPKQQLTMAQLIERAGLKPEEIEIIEDTKQA